MITPDVSLSLAALQVNFSQAIELLSRWEHFDFHRDLFQHVAPDEWHDLTQESVVIGSMKHAVESMTRCAEGHRFGAVELEQLGMVLLELSEMLVSGEAVN